MYRYGAIAMGVWSVLWHVLMWLESRAERIKTGISRGQTQTSDLLGDL
jgi:hypothetical protein